MKIIYTYRKFFLLMVLMIIGRKMICQVNLFTDFKAAHLAYNQIGGVEFGTGMEWTKNRNSIILNAHLVYAVGHRGFETKPGEYYTLLDGANRQDYPLAGIIPGLPESAYLKALKLKPAKTMDVGFSVAYGRKVIVSDKSNLGINVGINFSWIEESSILHEYKGDITNILGTGYGIYLVAPFTQNLFDLGPELGFSYEFISQKHTSFRISFDASWLTESGFKFSLGPGMVIKL